jgi:LCP family protein required for cell wall assembly
MSLLRGSRLRIVLVSGLALVLLALVGGVITLKMTANHYLNNVERLPDPFVSIPPSTRPSPVDGGTTFLLIGVDAEANDAAGRSDALMVARISSNRDHAVIISIPRDTWTDVPGHGTRKINAAFALGGPSLAVQTVEQLTELRIDHVAVIGFDGFRTMTDAVGGVEITIPRESASGYSQLPSGTQTLNGKQALAYVRQRYGLPNGDLDRTHRQQNFLRALTSQIMDRQTLTDPFKVNALLDAATKAISVDSGLKNDDLWRLVMEAPNLRNGMQFLNAPVDRLDSVVDSDGVEQSVVFLNEAECAELWKAIATDGVEDYVAKHHGDVLGPAPR